MSKDFIVETLKKQIENFKSETKTEKVGRVIEVGDGIARVSGLSDAMASEMLEFTTKRGPVYGVALNLEEDRVGAIILGDYLGIKEGDEVIATKKILEVPVGDALVGRVVNPLGKAVDGQDEIILAMIKMTGAKTGETGGHLHRVRAYTKILAMDLINNRPELQLTRRKAEDIARVSPLHDIGMMAISDAIINKPGRLSVEEIDLMKTHALVGGELLQEIHERTGLLYLHLAYEVASGHHERWDGSGYPKGLCGTDIPLAARIIAFADVFDALTTERCYKTAFSYEQAKKMVVAASGRHFDPMVVEAYLRQEVAWVAVMKQYQ